MKPISDPPTDTIRKGRVLIVDDDADLCLMLSTHLTRGGFDCQWYSSGRQVLEILAHERFDAVIADLRMPDVSGLDLLAESRNKYPSMAFLMATAEDDVRIGIEAMKQGAQDYLVKPFQVDRLVAGLERALEQKRLQIELATYRQRLEDMVEQRTRQLGAAMRRIEQTYDDTLAALGAALDLRDNETAGHARRVSRYCLEISRTMGCTHEQLRQIARGAYLHDIGKIGIPDSILRKPGKLTEEETAVMQTHARIGYELVNRIAFLAPAAEMVLTHQERFDGTGYPQGLLGHEIPLGSRIFAVADTLDAMTSDRPYRRALPFSAAREEIARQSGRQFDPDVVRAFFSLPEDLWERIRLEVAGLSMRQEAWATPESPGDSFGSG